MQAEDADIILRSAAMAEREMVTVSTAAGEAGAPTMEIEITPEMIEAGHDALASHHLDLLNSYGYHEIVKTVLEAMLAASEKPPRVIDRSAEYRLECHRKDV